MQEMFYTMLSKEINLSPEGRQRQGKNTTTNGYKTAENTVFSKAFHQKASRDLLNHDHTFLN